MRLGSTPSLIGCPSRTDVPAGSLATNVVVEAGHRDGIYLIGAGPRPSQKPAGSLAAVERLQGIKETLNENGIRAAGAIACSDWQPDLGYAAVRGLVDSGARLRGLICFNDRLALGAYNALADSGLSIPSDVSVVSFDDDPIASWIQPQLTTIAIPHYELGRRSIELLLGDGLNGDHQYRATVHRVAMPLCDRDSVSAPRP